MRLGREDDAASTAWRCHNSTSIWNFQIELPQKEGTGGGVEGVNAELGLDKFREEC
jgi:hypothetical protein